MALGVADLKKATEVIVKNHYLQRGRNMAQIPYLKLLDGAKPKPRWDAPSPLPSGEGLGWG